MNRHNLSVFVLFRLHAQPEQMLPITPRPEFQLADLRVIRKVLHIKLARRFQLVWRQPRGIAVIVDHDVVEVKSFVVQFLVEILLDALIKQNVRFPDLVGRNHE